jgi:hypothetical protein
MQEPRWPIQPQPLIPPRTPKYLLAIAWLLAAAEVPVTGFKYFQTSSYTFQIAVLMLLAFYIIVTMGYVASIKYASPTWQKISTLLLALFAIIVGCVIWWVF